MRLAVRLLRPAANQSGKPTLWQDPVHGYYEQHGDMEFKSGEDYGPMSEMEKTRVLHRNRVKQILKREYLRLEYDPFHYQYKQGAIMDPAMYRWYAAERSGTEQMRHTPRTVFAIYGVGIGVIALFYRLTLQPRESGAADCRDGVRPWWDRQQGRELHSSAGGRLAPSARGH